MKRNEIDSQLTWDLRFLFENQEALKLSLHWHKRKSNYCRLHSSLADDRASFISFMEHQETLERYLDNLISYAKMSSDVDLKICRTRKIWHAAIPCISR